MSYLLRGVRGAITICAALSVAACGDGDSPKAQSGGAASPGTIMEYSVKGYLVKDDTGTRYPVKFGPAPARTSKAERASGAAVEAQNAVAAPGIKTQSFERCWDGTDFCTPVDDKGIDEARNGFDGETLLLAIADSCMRDHRVAYPFGDNGIMPLWPDFPTRLEAAVANPTSANLTQLPRVWAGDSWFVFYSDNQVPASLGCDQVLARQEALLCTASRLSEIADTVGTTEIPTASGSHWAFPVQDMKDKFILRDLAIAALGHISVLESVVPINPRSGVLTFYDSPTPLRSCSDIYVKAMSIDTLSSQTSDRFTYAAWDTNGWLPLPQVAEVGGTPRTIGKAKELVAMRAESNNPVRDEKESVALGVLAENRSIGDRQDRGGVIYVRGGRRAVGSPEMAPVEGDHGRAFPTSLGRRRG